MAKALPANILIQIHNNAQATYIMKNDPSQGIKPLKDDIILAIPDINRITKSDTNIPGNNCIDAFESPYVVWIYDPQVVQIEFSQIVSSKSWEKAFVDTTNSRYNKQAITDKPNIDSKVMIKIFQNLPNGLK